MTDNRQRGDQNISDGVQNEGDWRAEGDEGSLPEQACEFCAFHRMPVSVMSVVSALVDFEIEKNNSSK
jgi:hypothetical protein